MPILLLGSSVFQLRRYADTATLPQSQGRTPRVRFRPLPGFYVFPAGWKCQPEGEDIGSGCCGGGVIQLRSRERALLRQGQLFEPAASSGPAAMVLAVSRSPSSIPRRSPCPERCHLPLASLNHIHLTKPQTYPRLPPTLRADVKKNLSHRHETPTFSFPCLPKKNKMYYTY